MRVWRDNAWLRFLSYFISIVLLFQFLVWSAAAGDDSLGLFVRPKPTDVFGTSEFSPVEILQSVALAACVALLLWHGWREPGSRPLASLLALVSLLMLVREQDYFIDRWLPWGKWLLPAAVVAAYAASVVTRSAAALRRQLRALVPTASFGLMFAGLTIVLGFSRVFGQKELWIALMDEPFQRVVKLAAEEMTELLGYCLLLAGCGEFCCHQTQGAAPPQQGAGNGDRAARTSGVSPL